MCQNGHADRLYFYKEAEAGGTVSHIALVINMMFQINATMLPLL